MREVDDISTDMIRRNIRILEYQYLHWLSRGEVPFFGFSFVDLRSAFSLYKCFARFGRWVSFLIFDYR